MDTFVSSDAALAFAMGVVFYIGLVHLWFLRRTDAPHLWVALWCLFSLLFQAGRALQIQADDPATAVAASRASLAAAPLLVWSLLCFGRSLSPQPLRAGPVSGLAVLALTWSGLIAGTSWFIGEETGTRTDWFGRVHISTPAGPAMALFLPAIALALTQIVRDIWTTRQLGPRERRVLMAALAAYAGMGVFSVLSAERWVSFPPTMEFGPLVVAVGLNYLLVHRHRRLQTSLEELVDERTQEIAAASRRLAESEARYRGLVEASPLGVFACDREGEVKAVNPKLLQILGSPHGGIQGRVNLFRDGRFVDIGVDRLLRECIQSGETAAGEFEYTSLYDRTSAVRLTVAPIRDASGQNAGALGVVEDISEQRALERRLRQSQKMESVGQLAAGIAHEINNPMTYVRANLSLLRDEWSGLRPALEKVDLPGEALERVAEWEELIDESLEGVDRTIAIVRDVREFSHQGGEVRVHADLEQLVENAVRMATPHRPEGVRLETHYGERMSLLCQPGPLRQVFLNLLVNALQAVGSGGRVSVTTTAEENEAVVRVEDDGCGIEPEIHDRLFDPFFTTKEAGEGTGLGLYISYQIIRLHGGHIRIRSVPAEGSVFEVRLPLEPLPPLA